MTIRFPLAAGTAITQPIAHSPVLQKLSATPVLIARCWRLRRGRAADFDVQRSARFDPIGDELARRLRDGSDHARALAPIARGLHGRVDDCLGGRKARIGLVLLRRVLQEQLGKPLLPRRVTRGRIGRSSDRTARWSWAGCWLLI